MAQSKWFAPRLPGTGPKLTDAADACCECVTPQVLAEDTYADGNGTLQAEWPDTVDYGDTDGWREVTIEVIQLDAYGIPTVRQFVGSVLVSGGVVQDQNTLALETTNPTETMPEATDGGIALIPGLGALTASLAYASGSAWTADGAAYMTMCLGRMVYIPPPIT